MKKRWILLPLALLLILSACTFDTPQPTQPSTLPTETDPTEPSVNLTETDPTEPSVTPTDPAAPHPSFEKLSIFIYNKDHSYSYINTSEISKCKEGYLYYYYDPLRKIVPICEEPVVDFAYDKVNFVFVKESDPTKLYWAPTTNLMQQEVIYESEIGVINDVYPENGGSYADKVVTLTEGNKRLALLDLASGEVILTFDEAYYINRGTFEGIVEVDEKPYCDLIWFWGQPKEGDRYYTWFYWVESGTFTLMEDG